MLFLVLTLQQVQGVTYNRLTAGAQVAPATPPPPQLASAFYQGSVVATPATVQAQLNDQQVALWQVENSPAWALSTHFYTLQVGGVASPRIVLLTVLPAKGGGEMRLYAGSLVLYDTYRSATLKVLATALKEQVKAEIFYEQTHDC